MNTRAAANKKKTTPNNLQWLCLAWAPYSRRTETFARVLSGKFYAVHLAKLQQPYLTPLRYLLQTISTLKILFAERPQAVLAQNPPFFCGLSVYFYTLFSGAKFALDHHSAAFAKVWNWARPLQQFLARKAVTNIVTNRHWQDIVRNWQAHALIMGDPFLPLPPGTPYPLGNGFNLVMVNTFAPDEPLEAVLQAAAQLPQVHFYITGNTRKKPPAFFKNIPANVTFTGFLPDEQYRELLRAADAVMSLTTRNYTLQLGGCEAVSVGKPLITSDWPFLQEFFSAGTVYVDNTAGGIVSGVLQLLQNRPTLKAQMLAFRESARRQWNIQQLQLIALVKEKINAGDYSL